MTGLTDNQSSVLQALFAAAPDAAMSNLERALAEAAEAGGAIASVHDMIARETCERRARTEVFAGLHALCRPAAGLPARFPSQTLRLLWTALRAEMPTDVRAAVTACVARDPDDAGPVDLYNGLCARAAKGLRGEEAAFTACIDLLEGFESGAAEDFAKFLDLAPLSRDALQRLPDWVARMTEDRTAAVRLAYKDAVAVADDAGPRLFDIFYANLSEPWLVLRLLSAVMDHPAERYVAVSELARFGELVLDDIDRRLNTFKAFDPDRGRPAGLLAAEAIHIAAQEITELEASVELNREGPWGKRLVKQKQNLASLAETRLGQIDKTLDSLLPVQMVKFGKGLRGLPKLVEDPSPLLLLRTEALMAFFDQSRGFAGQSGYGSMRTKVGEKIEARLDQYIEDLLEMLRAQEVECLDRVREYLEVSAGLMDWTRGEKAGQIVRRRIAAA